MHKRIAREFQGINFKMEAGRLKARDPPRPEPTQAQGPCQDAAVEVAEQLEEMIRKAKVLPSWTRNHGKNYATDCNSTSKISMFIEFTVFNKLGTV
jgi:hypothetical protein